MFLQTSVPFDDSKQERSIDEIIGDEGIASGYAMTEMMLQEEIKRGETDYVYYINSRV